MKGRHTLVISLILLLGNGASRGAPPDPLYTKVVALGTARGDRNASLRIVQEALALHKKGQLAKAETKWFEAARADPSWWKPVYNLGCVRSLQGRPDEAVALLREALRRGRFLGGHEYLNVSSGMEDGDLITYLYTDSDLRPIRQSHAFRSFLRTDLGQTEFASLKGKRIRCSLTSESARGGQMDRERRLKPGDPGVVYRADYDLSFASGGVVQGTYTRGGGQHRVKMKRGRWAVIDGSLYLLFEHQYTNYPCGDPANCSVPDPFAEVNVMKSMREVRERFPECGP